VLLGQVFGAWVLLSAEVYVEVVGDGLGRECRGELSYGRLSSWE
jgi:hypothetical protein